MPSTCRASVYARSRFAGGVPAGTCGRVRSPFVTVVCAQPRSPGRRARRPVRAAEPDGQAGRHALMRGPDCVFERPRRCPPELRLCSSAMVASCGCDVPVTVRRQTRSGSPGADRRISSPSTIRRRLHRASCLFNSAFGVGRTQAIDCKKIIAEKTPIPGLKHEKSTLFSNVSQRKRVRSDASLRRDRCHPRGARCGYEKFRAEALAVRSARPGPSSREQNRLPESARAACLRPNHVRPPGH